MRQPRQQRGEHPKSASGKGSGAAQDSDADATKLRLGEHAEGDWREMGKAIVLLRRCSQAKAASPEATAENDGVSMRGQGAWLGPLLAEGP